jgi:epoxyqueuosine reductase
MPELDDPGFQRLVAHADGLGLLRLGIVRLDHPGFQPAREELARFLTQGKAGVMGYIERGRSAREDPGRLLAGARSVLIAAVPYRGELGAIARYAQAADYHTELHRRFEVLSNQLTEMLPGVATRVCVDTKPLLERSVAVLAGLGFIGKQGSLIVPGLGTHVLLGAMLTTAEWVGPDRAHPQVAERLAGRGELWDACGTCTACLEVCPTDAFDGPGQLDPRRCISYLTLEYRGEIPEALAARMGRWIAGCDDCQDACPYNRSEQRDAKVAEHVWIPKPPGRPRVVDLPALANVGNNQHRVFVRHTALNRIPRRALRRNALIALANGIGPLDARGREALLRAMEDPDDGLRRLARWAAQRRGLAEIPLDESQGTPRAGA